MISMRPQLRKACDGALDMAEGRQSIRTLQYALRQL